MGYSLHLIKRVVSFGYIASSKVTDIPLIYRSFFQAAAGLHIFLTTAEIVYPVLIILM